MRTGRGTRGASRGGPRRCPAAPSPPPRTLSGQGERTSRPARRASKRLKCRSSKQCTGECILSVPARSGHGARLPTTKWPRPGPDLSRPAASPVSPEDGPRGARGRGRGWRLWARNPGPGTEWAQDAGPLPRGLAQWRGWRRLSPRFRQARPFTVQSELWANQVRGSVEGRCACAHPSPLSSRWANIR